jgi:hypothetical protein
MMMDDHLEREARNTGAQTPEKLAHLAHRPNQGHIGDPSIHPVEKERNGTPEPDERKTPRSKGGARQYRYGDSNPGFWHEKPAS